MTRAKHLALQIALLTLACGPRTLHAAQNGRIVLPASVAPAHYAIVFTPRNQDGGAPWSVVQQVQFTNNVVQHTASGFNIRGIPTVIVFKNGKEAARQSGAVPKKVLEDLLARA